MPQALPAAIFLIYACNVPFLCKSAGTGYNLRYASGEKIKGRNRMNSGNAVLPEKEKLYNGGANAPTLHK